KKTLRVLQPRLIVLAELELWPNWLLLAEKADCPVAIINGRLSERSFNGYARIPYLVRKCMQSIDWVGAQSQSYATRFEKLGVPSARLAVTGNIKFDGATGNRFASEVETRKELLGLSEPTGLVFLAGSTQAPEESIVLTAFLELAKRFPQLRLILVPRHAERFEEVAKMIAATGLPWLRRTTFQTAVIDPGWRIFLGDTVGELRWWWGLADVGFVGGSFGDRGGQNMIEPCAYGVATCFGPNTRNFSDIVRLLIDEKASEQLQSPEDLQPWLESMLSETTKREQMSTQAIQICERHRGASQRTWANLQRLLPRRSRSPKSDAVRIPRP
ncbi:MAG TPA: glycosyltransferase N-terminal domain-containing protein, partial [Pirellula sp.]|nr:glycosyltransferase N-terminal domain-containing protein [Pirellula sp.]